MSERKSVIITFKPKDQRPDQQMDKLEIVRGTLAKGTRAHFFDAATLGIGAGRPPIEEQVVGYDVNQYEAPIVSAQLTKSEIDALRKNGNVAKVEDDVPCYAFDYGPFQHLQVQDQPSETAETIPAGVAQVKATAAWGNSMGKGIRVGVVDTGIDFNHPDLKVNYVGGATFVPGTSTPMDDHGHGTHCSGTIAAAMNGAGVVGVAPQASLYAAKVLDKNGSGQFSWVIAGIDWCIQHRMHIISMSLGGGSAPTALETICNTAWSKGGIDCGGGRKLPRGKPGATRSVKRRLSRKVQERYCCIRNRLNQCDCAVQQPRTRSRPLRPGCEYLVNDSKWPIWNDERHEHGLPARVRGCGVDLGSAPILQ